MRSVYIAPEVAELFELHPYVAETKFIALPIREQVGTLAETLCAAHKAGDARIRMQVMCWWPGASRRTLEAVLASEFSESDALLTVSREYGFSDWQSVVSFGELTPDPLFEQALETMLAGNVEELKSHLDETPSLANQRSKFGHHSTLLHYLGANGVESHRQRMPLNATEMAIALIAKGASKTAEANMYGGGQTPFALASTSAHPRNAGISAKLNRILSTDESA